MKQLIIFIVLFISVSLKAQNPNTNIELTARPILQNGKIIVKYKINNGISFETYNITISFLMDNNNTVNPFSLKGDINNISGNNEKTIIWDYSKDIDFAPKIRKTILRIKKINHLPVKINITSKPSAAKVYIDNIYDGLTPFSDKTISGEHKISVVLDGYKPFISYPYLNKKINNYNFVLVAKKYNLRLITKPENSTIYIDYDSVKSLSGQFFLNPGKHKIMVKSSGLISQTKPVIINNDFKIKRFFLKPKLQFGIGYIFGSGTIGIEMILRGPHTEFAMNYMGITPLRNIGFANYTAIGVSFGFGYRVPYPIDFSLNVGLGVRSFVNADNTDENIQFYTLTTGFTIPLYIKPRVASFYIKTDYWIHTEYKSIVLFTIGIIVGSSQ